MKLFRTRVYALADAFGLDRLLFLTLTFPRPVTDVSEAHERWKSLRGNLVNERYVAWIRVTERDEAGKLHLHVLLCPRDGLGAPRGKRLSDEQTFWREAAPRYGFGRTEIKPVRNLHALERYLKKYVQNREVRDRWERLAASSRSLSKILADKERTRDIITPFQKVGPSSSMPKKTLPAIISFKRA